MKRFLLLSVLASAMAVHGQEISTPSVGFSSVTCPSGSDTYVSVSFNRPMAFLGAVSTVGAGTVAPEGTLAWTANQFVTPGAHFVKFITGAKAGAYYEVTGNSSNELTLNLAGDSLTGVLEGDRIAVIPYWTLDALFPVGNTTIHQSISTSSPGRRTQVLFPDLSGTGVNLAPSGVYYQTSTGWKDALNANASVNPRLEPDQFIIIRHRTQETGTTFAAVGSVDSWAVRSVLSSMSNVIVDNPVSNLRPMPVKLKNLGLITSGAFVGSAGTGSHLRKDILFIHSNTTQGFNKAPNHIYFYNIPTNQWMDALEGNRVSDDDVIAPATGFVIRKARTAGGASSLWTHNVIAE